MFITRLILLVLFANTSIASTGVKIFDASSEIYMKACDLGFTDSCFDYWKRAENQIDQERRFKKKCAKGKNRSCFRLGLIEEASGNFTEALKLYKKACKGVAVACLRIGETLFHEKSFDEAKPYLEKGCTQKLGNSCYLLAQVLNEQAVKLLKVECESKQSKSCDYLARGSEKREETNESLKKACDGGVFRSCFKLAKALNREFDVMGARSLYEKACEGNHLLACSELGYLENLAGNDKVAKKYYSKACKGGEKTGCEKMKHLTD